MLIYVPSTGQIISREASYRTFTLVDKSPKTWNWTPNKYFISLDKPENNIIVSRIPEPNTNVNPINVQCDSPRDFIKYIKHIRVLFDDDEEISLPAAIPIAVQLQDANISGPSTPILMPIPDANQLLDNTTTSADRDDKDDHESDSDEDTDIDKTHYATDDDELSDGGDNNDDDNDDKGKGTLAPNQSIACQITQSNIPTQTTRKSSRQSKPPAKYSDYSYGYSMTIKQANKSHRELAKEATINELNNMETKNVFKFKPVKITCFRQGKV